MGSKSRPPQYKRGDYVKTMTVTGYAGHYKEKANRPYASHHFHLVCDAGHEITLPQASLKSKLTHQRDNCCPVCQGEERTVEVVPVDYEQMRTITQMVWV